MAVFESSINSAYSKVKEAVAVSAEKLLKKSGELATANDRIQEEVLKTVYDYETFCSYFQGDCRYAFIGAMQTLYGKRTKLNRLVSQSADALIIMSDTMASVNDEANASVSMEE